MNKLMDALLNRKKYKGLSWSENFMGGHISFGPITMFGDNAMHWGVTVKTKRWGYVCFRLPFRSHGCWFPLYFYLSQDATPNQSTLYFGKDKLTKESAKLRRNLYGHNSRVTYEQNQEIENRAYRNVYG